MSGTIEFHAPCPECGRDSLWVNGLQFVGEPRRQLYVGGGIPPDMRPQVVTTTIDCRCQPKDTPCAAP